MIWCLSASFHFISSSLVSLAEKAFMATPVRVSAAQSVVSFPVPVNSSQMQVRKRNGSFEPADVNKIVRAVERCCEGRRRTLGRPASRERSPVHNANQDSGCSYHLSVLFFLNAHRTVPRTT